MPLSDSEGKSEATIRLQMLGEAMIGRYMAYSEAWRVPLGVQEVGIEGWRKWWKAAGPEARMNDLLERGGGDVRAGWQGTMEMLGPDLFSGQNGRR